MSAEDLACCLKCQMTFTTHEELFVHSCVYIKVEANDYEESTAFDFSNERDFKHDIVRSNSSEADSDYSPKKKKCKQRKMSKRKVENVKKNEDSPKTKCKIKKHKIKKEKPKYEFDEPNILEDKKNTKLSEGMNLDLTEEFINFVLQQVDELCENIKNGDPDNERTLEVNRNLNNAVSCYRGKLDLEKQIMFIQSDNEDGADIDYYPEIPKEKGKGDGDGDIYYKPKIGNKARKKKVSKVTKPNVSRAKKTIKETSGSKNIDESSKDQPDPIKFFSESSIKNKKYKVVYTKSDDNAPKEKVKVPTPIPTKDYSYCLELMKEATDNPKNEQLEFKNEILLEFMDLSENDILHCSLCNKARPLKDKSNMFRHMRSVHKNELKAKSKEIIDSDSIEQKFDCEKGICLKLYGPFHRKLWCLKCIEARSEVTQIGKTMKKIRQQEKKLKQKESGITKEKEICPECGAKVTNVKQHIKFKHEIDKQKCPQCGKEFKNVLHLQSHMKFHEKVPCPHCGKPYVLSKLNLHIEAQHTSNEDKRFKCDICGKGFNANQPLKDHINIHTGEKPYKCKYCSASFASRGNHGMHERSHLGHRRK